MLSDTSNSFSIATGARVTMVNEEAMFRSWQSAVTALSCHYSKVQKSRAIAILLTELLLTGCARHAADAGDSPHASDAEHETADEWGFPDAHPAFAAHFTDPIYDAEADEFAPFGTDEGWDMLHEWGDRRAELRPGTTVADLIEGSGLSEFVTQLDVEEGPGIPEPGGQVDAAVITISAGFTLLRLTGQIDDAGRQRTLKALDILIERYESPAQLLQQRADLQSWSR